MKKTIPYLLLAFVFYIIPLLMQDTGSSMFILLVIIPKICLIISIIYGMKNYFNWKFPLITMAMFIPTIFIFYNNSATIYIFVYGIVALIGNYLGSIFYKKINS